MKTKSLLKNQTPRKAKDKEKDEEGRKRGSVEGGEDCKGGKDEAGEEVDGQVLGHRRQVWRWVA